MHIDDNQNPFSLVADFEGDESSVFDVEMEATLPILPLRNMVLFPGVVMPVAVGRKSSLRLAKAELQAIRQIKKYLEKLI